MSKLTTLPMHDLTIEDVRDTLNGYGGDVNNEVSSFFAASANINKWSKHKPIAHTRAFIRPADFEDVAKEVNYGLAVGNTEFDMTDLAQLCVAASAFSLAWTYNRPTGSQYEPFRMGDFCGYEPEAVNWLRITARLSTEGGTRKLYVTLAEDDLQNMVAQWGGLEDYDGFGFAIWKGTDYYYYHGGPIAQWSEFDGVVINSTFTAGDYHVVLCLDKDSRSPYWVEYKSTSGEVIALPVESVSDLPTFTLRNSDPQPDPPTERITILGEYTYKLTTIGDTIECAIRTWQLEIDNISTTASASVTIDIMTNTMQDGWITQQESYTIAAGQSVTLYRDLDLHDEFYLFYLPSGYDAPIFRVRYTYLGTTYTYEMAGTEVFE